MDEAIALAQRSPCDPLTLSRAARDFATKNPVFAAEAGMAAIHWLLQGYGYEITGADVHTAYDRTLTAAGDGGRQEVQRRLRSLLEEARPGNLAAEVLGRELAREGVHGDGPGTL